jgi:hypothetical protein
MTHQFLCCQCFLGKSGLAYVGGDIRGLALEINRDILVNSCDRELPSLTKRDYLGILQGDRGLFGSAPDKFGEQIRDEKTTIRVRSFNVAGLVFGRIFLVDLVNDRFILGMGVLALFENLIDLIFNASSKRHVIFDFDSLMKSAVESYSKDFEFMSISTNDYHGYGNHPNQLVVYRTYMVFEKASLYSFHELLGKLKQKLKPKVKLCSFTYDGKVRMVMSNKEDSKNLFGKELSDGCSTKCFTKSKMVGYTEREIDTDSLNVQL